MGDVISFGDNAPGDGADKERLEDTILLEEGLDLLASYRSIPDLDVRLSLKTLVESVVVSFSRRDTSDK